MSQHTKDKVFTLTILKAQEKIKNFQNIFDKKTDFTFKCLRQKEKIQKTFQIYFMVKLRDFRSKGNKILTLIFDAK